MIFTLLNALSSFGIKVPAVFEYTSTRMMLAALTSLVFCIFLGPYFIRKLYEMRIGQTIRKEECPLLGELHQKKQDTPTMGGVLMLVAMLLSLFLWMDLSNVFTLILFAATVVLGSVGVYDDYLKLKHKNTKGLSGKKKLLWQVGVSALLAFYMLSPFAEESLGKTGRFAPPVVKEKEEGGKLSAVPFSAYARKLYVPFMKQPLHLFSGAFVLGAALLTVFVVTGASNAVNLTDGLDGLASGCIVMVALCLAFIAFLTNNSDLARYLNIPYVEGTGEIAIYLSAMIGACLGFLWYNGHPAQLFMGDTGSLTLGGIIGVAAVLLKRELLLGIIGGIFVAEALSVILQVGSYRLRNKKRIFLCAPLHHHFEYKGWAETKVVVRFWIIGLILALVGLASLKFQ